MIINLIQYQTIDHTADIGIKVFGSDVSDLFKNAGLAMFDLICEIKDLNKEETYHISADGEDWADLIIAWLRELLYLWSGNELIVNSMDICSIYPYKICANVFCVHFDPGFHAIKHDIKAATYHNIEVKKTPDGWVANIIFDV